MTTASNSSNDRKVKVLLFGPISTQDDWTTFSKKLTALHTSKSGPFHVAFVVGPCAALSHDDTSTSTLTLPIPVYLQEGWNPTSTTTTDDVSLPDGIVLLARNLFWLRGNSRLDQEPCGNIWNLAIPTQPQQQHHLVVAVCPRLFRSTDDEDAYLLTQLRHASYIGCDLLLTNEGPQGIESTMISPATTTANNNNHTNHNNSWMTSYDVAQVALLARARYHVAASCYNTTSNATGALFAQSHPFAHLPSLSSTRPIRHVGRFLNLAPVSSKKHTTKLDKEQYKFVHALGIIPLQEMTSVDWQEQQPSSQPILPCPFTDASYQLDGTGVSSSTTTTASVGLSEAQARRLIMASYSQSDHNNSRWEMKNSRKRKHAPESGGGKDEAEEDDDITNTTLFVHGMHLDVSGQLQRTDSILLLQAFAKYHALRVRRPQGGGTTTSFAFVEFATHEQAKACLQDHPQGTMVIQGVSLTLKWAKRNANNTKKQQQQQQDAPRKTLLLTEQEAHDSSTLYFRYLDPQEILQDKDSGGNAAEKEEAGSANPVSKLTVVTTACELLRKLMEHTLEQALMGDDDEGAADADAAAAVTAATEPALQVSLGRVQCKSTKVATTVSLSSKTAAKTTTTTRQRLDDEDDHYGEEGPLHEELPSQISQRTISKTYWYGFLQFASHAAASMALASLTGSIQGGEVQPDQLPLSKLTPPPPTDDAENNMYKSSLLLFQGGLILRWAMDGAGSTDRPQKMVDPWAELGLQRRHFPADARTDCWFCLASPTCERHLITGVYHDWYLTLPKGPVHPGHMLLVPVVHSSRGAARLTSAKDEFDDLLERLRAHAEEVYGRQLFVFERAFQTKGGYHTHVQCIPVEHGLGIRLQTTLLAASSRLGMNLRELSSDVQLATILSSAASSNGDDDGEDGNDELGYFYAEVPSVGNTIHRFLYTAKARAVENDRQRGGSSSSRSVIPSVQFGREALAAVLNQPDLAHWKACVVDQEKETELATTFRQSFAQFAPASSS